MSSAFYNKLLKAAGIAAVITGGIAFANKFMTRHALSSDTPIISEQYFEWHYGRVYYTCQGNGTPVLLIHGLYPGANGAAFNDWAGRLAETHTVYTIDLPGFGLSDKPQLTYTAYLYAQMLNDFTEYVIQKPVCIVTEDRSCSFCSIACQLNPRLYSGLLLLNPTTPEEEETIPRSFNRILRQLIELPLLGTLIYNISTTKKHLHSLYPDQISEDLLNTCYARAHRKLSGARFAYASLANHYINANISRSLSKLDTSVYVVLSGSDTDTQKQVSYLSSLNPSIEFELVEGSRHMLWIQHPDKLLEILHIFL